MTNPPIEIRILSIVSAVIALLQVAGIVLSAFLLRLHPESNKLLDIGYSKAIFNGGFVLNSIVSIIFLLIFFILSILLIKPKKRFRNLFFSMFLMLIALDFIFTGSIGYIAVKIPLAVVIAFIIFSKRAGLFYGEKP
jgi:hypothetical protein